MRAPFSVGDPVPNFVLPCSNGNPRFHFDTIAGQFIILTFIEDLRNEGSASVISFVNETLAPYFKGGKSRFFAVTTDPNAPSDPNYQKKHIGIDFFYDANKEVSKRYHCCDDTGAFFNRMTFILDISLRVVDIFSLDDVDAHNQRLHKHLTLFPEIQDHAGTRLTAPVLIVPRILDRNYCNTLINYYKTHEAQSGHESGFMREIDGKTVYHVDHEFKRRRDCQIADPQLRDIMTDAIFTRLAPEIEKAFQFKVTYIERFIIARYSSETGGFFRQHRDNTTKGTAHRRFAVTINLNAGEFQGGDLCFPEFGPLLYKAPTGGAIVFSCSLLHQCIPVTKGVRYCTLPFLYGDQDAELRKKNLPFIDKDSYSTQAHRE